MSSFTLRDLEFSIEYAEITGSFQNGILSCYIDVEMNCVMQDDESWSPLLCHQGLKIKANSWEELSGMKIDYQVAYTDEYEHPEIGMLYVFGHEETRKNLIEFGRIENRKIYFKWSGISNVYWDEKFGIDVPFKLDSLLEIKDE